MTGIEIIGLVAAILGVIETINHVYAALKDRNDLPEAFKQVNARMSLVEATLQTAKTQTRNIQDESEAKSVEETLTRCKLKLTQLSDIFNKILQAKGQPVLDAYRREVLHLGKKHRVENLMESVLEDTRQLATFQVFKTATGDQVVEELKKAQEEMAKIARENPSLPDSDFASQSPTFTSHWGKGHIVNQSGTGNTHVAGDNYSSKGDMMFGMSWKPRKPSRPKDDGLDGDSSS